MPGFSSTTDENRKPLNSAVVQFRLPKHCDLPLVTESKSNKVEPSTSSSSSSSSSTISSSTMSSCCSLKRKRPPKIEIPLVLREIQTDKIILKERMVEHQPIGFDGAEVGVFSLKGKKKVMEDTHKIVSGLYGASKKGFFGVYDGHGGRKAAEFVAENLHRNILEMLETCRGDIDIEDAIKAGYLKTDQDFLKQGVSSGTCCVTALIEGKDIVVSNLGDCRAVLCRDGVAEVLTKDHRAEQEEERDRIEKKGGYVEIHRGAWRVHGILSVSRSIGDVHLKDWVMAEPDTKILHWTPAMEFLVLASDGLWEKVGNQEAVDTVKHSCLVANQQKFTVNLWKEVKDEFGSENTSPSKAWGLSLANQQKKKTQSPRKESSVYKDAGNLWKDEDLFGCENTSPPSKSRRISLIKQHKVKIHSPSQDNSQYKCRPTSSGLMAACKKLVNLAVNRGSLDDITVMIIDLKQFQHNSC